MTFYYGILTSSVCLYFAVSAIDLTIQSAFDAVLSWHRQVVKISKLIANLSISCCVYFANECPKLFTCKLAQRSY